MKKTSFVVGLSGKCVHVQILGARNLVVADANGTSDPFLISSFCGKQIGSTRIRPRELNPNWTNETVVVPMEPDLPYPRKVSVWVCA